MARIVFIETVEIPLIESEPNEDKLVIEHCDNIYEEMWRISINNPMNYL